MLFFPFGNIRWKPGEIRTNIPDGEYRPLFAAECAANKAHNHRTFCGE